MCVSTLLLKIFRLSFPFSLQCTQGCRERPFLPYAGVRVSQEGQLCRVQPTVHQILSRYLPLPTREETEDQREDVTCSESLRVWDRCPVQGSSSHSTLPFQNPPFPDFYFAANPSDHPAGLIRADLGETHYQCCPGGLGIWQCFQEETGKK